MVYIFSYIYTLKCHLDYVARVIHKYSQDRLPNKLARKVIEKDLYCFSSWEELCQKHDVNANILRGDFQTLRNTHKALIRKESSWLLEKTIERGRAI